VAPTFAPCAIVAPPARVDQRQRKKNALLAPVWPRVALRGFLSHTVNDQDKTSKREEFVAFDF